MKKKVTTEAEVLLVKRYVSQEFGLKELATNVVAPSRNSTIEVVEPLETCHPTSGYNLDDNQCIPVGVYKVSSDVKRDVSSHWLDLECIEGEKKGLELSFCTGYSIRLNPQMGSNVDWRGARKAEEAV